LTLTWEIGMTERGRGSSAGGSSAGGSSAGGSSAGWAVAERRSPPMAWLILVAGTTLCVLAAFLS
jgi:hypothetical protein